jgi:type I restriction enzyme S subunit
MSVKSLGQIAKIRRGASPRPIGDPKFFGGEVGWIRISDVSAASKYLKSTTQYVSKLGERNSVRLDKGDLILSICATIGRPVILDIPACIHDGFVHLYDLNESDKEYLYYYLQFAEEQLKALGQSGTQVNLNTALVGKLRVYHPRLPEQTQIAAVLSQVDRAIEQTEALVAKQERIKAGLLQDLLTKGLDEAGNVRREETHEFKDSPLGRIPVEWDVKTWKECATRIQDGTHFSPRTDENGEYKYLTSKNIRFGYLDLNDCEYVSSKAHALIYKRCSVAFGDVLLTKDGANTGNAAINTLEEPFSLLSSVAFIRCNSRELIPGYLLQVILSYNGQKLIKDAMSGLAITRITLIKINTFLIALPPAKEQEKIVALINRHDERVYAEKASLTKLQAQKTGLMQDLLTGRVSVAPLLDGKPSTR